MREDSSFMVVPVANESEGVSIAAGIWVDDRHRAEAHRAFRLTGPTIEDIKRMATNASDEIKLK